MIQSKQQTVWATLKNPDNMYSESDMIDFAQFYESRKSAFPNWGTVKVFLEKWQEEKDIMNTPPNYSGEPSMPYMTASEAREIAEKAIPKIEEMNFQNLVYAIKRFAEDGKTNILKGKPTEKLISRLRELGYAVERGFTNSDFRIFVAINPQWPDENCTTPAIRISWGGENE